MKKSYLFLLIFYRCLLATVVNNNDYVNINEEIINIEAINIKEKRKKLAKLILIPLLFTSLANFYFILNNYKNSNKNICLIGAVISFLQVLFVGIYYFIFNFSYKIFEIFLYIFFLIMFIGNLMYLYLIFYLKTTFLLNVLYASDNCNNNINYIKLIMVCNNFMRIFISLIFYLRNINLSYQNIISLSIMC